MRNCEFCAYFVSPKCICCHNFLLMADCIEAFVIKHLDGLQFHFWVFPKVPVLHWASYEVNVTHYCAEKTQLKFKNFNFKKAMSFCR